MAITEEEKEEIINKAVEKALLMLPEVVGNLMTHHIAMSKINAKFYADHPEFRDHKEAVVSVIEKVEGANPLLKYEEILNIAIPEIRSRIETEKNLNTDSVSSNINLNFKDVKDLSNGVL